MVGNDLRHVVEMRIDLSSLEVALMQGLVFLRGNRLIHFVKVRLCLCCFLVKTLLEEFVALFRLFFVSQETHVVCFGILY